MTSAIATIGVRDLKAHLSACLRRIQTGAALTVTDRGRAIAVLSPVNPPANIEWVHTMVAAGRARWAGGKPAGLRPRLRAGGRPASRMVLEDRR